MKIALNMGQTEPPSRTTHLRALEQDILAAQKGDWNAKSNLVHTFTSLLNTLAEKRSTDRMQINQLVETGKVGLYAAAKKYKPSIGPERFQILALDFIEKCMDQAVSRNFRKPGLGTWFTGLFGR